MCKMQGYEWKDISNVKVTLGQSQPVDAIIYIKKSCQLNVIGKQESKGPE